MSDAYRRAFLAMDAPCEEYIVLYGSSGWGRHDADGEARLASLLNLVTVRRQGEEIIAGSYPHLIVGSPQADL